MQNYSLLYLINVELQNNMAVARGIPRFKNPHSMGGSKSFWIPYEKSWLRVFYNLLEAMNNIHNFSGLK